MSEHTLDDYQKKLAQFKKAIQNNEFPIDSNCIAEALLEAQRYAKKEPENIEEPELV